MGDTNDFWTAVDITVMDADADSLQSRRDARMARCGQDIHIEEMPDGSRKITHWRCKDPRCPNCNRIRATQFMQRILDQIKLQDIRVAWVFKKQADKLCRKIGRKDYLRFPQENDIDIVFFSSDLDELKSISLPVDLEFINKFDWIESCRKKTTRIVSGTLGASVEETSKSKYNFIGHSIVASPLEAIENAYALTCTEVIVWQQPDVERVNQDIRNFFNSMLIKNIALFGGRIHLMYETKIRADELELHLLNLDKSELESDS